MSEREDVVEELSAWLWRHEHGHVSSNNPGGHLCSRHCLATALARSEWIAEGSRGKSETCPVSGTRLDPDVWSSSRRPID